MHCSSNLNATDALALHHTWPLWEQARHFDLGCILSSAVIDLIQPAIVGDLGLHHAGCWECDLSNNSLIWSGGVYDLFGLPRGTQISRENAVSFYSEESRATMERLRSYAIRHRCGFTLDAEIRPAAGAPRWMRLIAVPVYSGDRAVRLHGMKLII